MEGPQSMLLDIVQDLAQAVRPECEARCSMSSCYPRSIAW